MKNTIRSDEKLAAKYACDTRTIRRWRRDRAPLQNDQQMRAWLAGRKNLPAGTRVVLDEARTRENADQSKATPSKSVGAAAALRRLERAEERAYAAFQVATESGDAVAIRNARETWLRVSESLRKYDVAIEESRRDAGELVPRSEIEKILSWLGSQLRLTIRQLSNQLGPEFGNGYDDYPRVRNRLYTLFTDALLTIGGMLDASLQAWEQPEWVMKAFVRNIYEHSEALIGETVKQRSKILQAFIALGAGDKVPLEELEEGLAAGRRGDVPMAPA